MKKVKKKSRGVAENALLVTIMLLTIYQVWLFFKPAIEFGEWKYITEKTNNWYLKDKIDDTGWQAIELPFNMHYERNRLFFRGTLFVPEDGNAKFTFFVDDCVEDIYVNGQIAFQYSDCGSCTHCNGVGIDLSEFVKLGENSFAIEVMNINNTGTGFDVKKVEETSWLWVIVALLIGAFIAINLEKR